MEKSATLLGIGSQDANDEAKIALTFMTELMTIGYENLSTTEFYDILQRCRVTMLVDVRELAISRKSGFAKNALAVGLEAHGHKYMHLVELGCPRDIRHQYREDGDWKEYTKGFKAYLETQQEALKKLAALIKQERCCLMCYEEDYNFCHRSFVANRVAEQVKAAVKINHLTGPMTGRVAVRREVVAA